MKSTRWIAVALCLIASPAVVLSEDDAPAFEQPESLQATSQDAQQNETPLTLPLSFDAELEQLRQDIATTKQLREKSASEAGQPYESDAAAAQEQRRILLELLTKLAAKKVEAKSTWEPPPPPRVIPPPPAPKIDDAHTTAAKSDSANSAATPTHPLITEKIVDPYALGRALFRAGDYVGAEQAFRKVTATNENRVLLQYLVATCLRKQSRWEQAAKAYRTIAEQKEDPTLRDLAIWQLDNIRWNQSTNTQLEELRKLRQPLESPPESSLTNPNTPPIQ